MSGLTDSSALVRAVAPPARDPRSSRVGLWRAALLASLLVLCLRPALPQGAILESAREIPLAYRADVLVVGGTTGAVSAAVAAAGAGARVVLVAPRPYLGEDMAATLRLWLEPDEAPNSPLAQAVYGGEPVTTPLRVKRALDDALLAARVEFLYGSFATDVLRDEAGAVCGIVMANRAGRQAITAKVIIDATERGTVARLAGARFLPFPAGMQTFRRVVLSQREADPADFATRTVPYLLKEGAEEYRIAERTMRVSMPDGTPAAWAEAEQRVRDLTYDPAMARASEAAYQIPPDPMVAETPGRGEWPGADALGLGALRPQGVPSLYVLGGCADLPYVQVERLLRPVTFMAVGARVGAAAAKDATARPDITSPRVVGAPGGDSHGEVREALGGVRPIQALPTVPSEARPLPVWGRYDVVVIGGGTSGAPAGIAAARKGARVLVVEYQPELGGVGTQGAIASYYRGNRVGFTKEVPGDPKWSIIERAEWWRTALRKAGGDLWLGAMGCGAVVRDGRVVGAVIASPHGRGVVLAKVVVDATGNSDVAAAAGAATIYTDDSDVAVQGAGLPAFGVKPGHMNTDFTFVDETDMIDVWRLMVAAKLRYRTAFDVAQFIDTRERRRIVGDYTLTILDAINGRTYPDIIVTAQTDYDSHGYTIDPYFGLAHPGKGTLRTHVPYRCLLPKGLEGILVIGLGASAHRDVVPVIRMQPDIQNQGYAAGYAAAMAAQEDTTPRAVDVRRLQQHLVRIGGLPAAVLTLEDSYPIPADRLRTAVANLPNGYADVGVVMAAGEDALPLLREAHAAAVGDAALTYAHVLAMMHDPTGVPALIAALEVSPWDTGWTYKAMGQYGPSLSRVDSLIMALGRARDPRAVPAILAKARLLTPASEFSHYRAVAMALESIGAAEAAPVLADLLRAPEVSGHAMPGFDGKLPIAESDRTRERALREITLARALFRCGDQDGLALGILRQYAVDLRGHYARHAAAVLAKAAFTSKAPQ